MPASPQRLPPTVLPPHGTEQGAFSAGQGLGEGRAGRALSWWGGLGLQGRGMCGGGGVGGSGGQVPGTGRRAWCSDHISPCGGPAADALFKTRQICRGQKPAVPPDSLIEPLPEAGPGTGAGGGGAGLGAEATPQHSPVSRGHGVPQAAPWLLLVAERPPRDTGLRPVRTLIGGAGLRDPKSSPPRPLKGPTGGQTGRRNLQV